MKTVVHLAAQDVWVEGRYVRQRCAWCGELLIDVDLARIAVHPPLPEGERPIATWQPGAMVEASGVWPTVYRQIDDDGRIPINSCMEDVSPRIRAVPSATEE